MFRHELSEFLRDVLDAVARRPRGIGVGAAGDPNHDDLAELVYELRADPADIALALEGLRAAHCLVEHVVEFEGAEPLCWWTVHPQVAATSPSGS